MMAQMKILPVLLQLEQEEDAEEEALLAVVDEVEEEVDPLRLKRHLPLLEEVEVLQKLLNLSNLAKLNLLLQREELLLR
jgi:hypothetical protein